MWEATFTYGGESDEPGAEWYLLSLEFLFRVRDARGVWAGVPVGPMKEHILELCNRQLAKRRQPVDLTTDTSAEEPEAVPGDAPLVRGYAFLQRLALRYQLEAVHAQALRLAGAWSGNLRVERGGDGSRLVLDYWVAPVKPVAPGPPGTQAPPPMSALTGKVIISFSAHTSVEPIPIAAQPVASTSAQPAAPLRSARERALEQALAKVAAARLAPITAAIEPVPTAGGNGTVDKGKGVALADDDDVLEKLSIVWVADDVPLADRAQLTLELVS